MISRIPIGEMDSYREASEQFYSDAGLTKERADLLKKLKDDYEHTDLYGGAIVFALTANVVRELGPVLLATWAAVALLEEI